MGKRHLITTSIALVLLAAGCGEPSPILCGGAPCESQKTLTNVFQTTVNHELDILFVVDDTSAFAPYAPVLASSMVKMANQLQNLGFVPSLHVGFVPASDCGSGVITRGADCGLASSMQYLKSETCGQQTNFAGTLADSFACLADFGVKGCAPAQPLAAIDRTLGAGAPGWAGFLRDGAFLLIVVIAAEDDASGPAGTLDPVSKTVDFVRGLKADPASQVAVSVVGPGDCSGATDAMRAPRLLALVLNAVGNSYLPICAEDFATALYPVTTSLGPSIGPPCFDKVRDVDPATPGLQADCSVTETVVRPDGSTTSALLPSCDQGAPPCWKLGPDDITFNRCPGRLAVSIVREATYCSDGNTRTRFECLGCLDPNDPACALPVP